MRVARGFAHGIPIEQDKAQHITCLDALRTIEAIKPQSGVGILLCPKLTKTTGSQT